MADWRQIQARIRKAKNGSDAQAKLSELFERTRDAMVAWELGAIEEKAERKGEAGSWYTIAAQRFRRADWRKKAEEALTRLGVELPPPQTEIPKMEKMEKIERAEISAEIFPASTQEPQEVLPGLALGEIPMMADEADENEGSQGTNPAGGASASEESRKKRRRGRRGGRGRRRKGPGAPASGLPAQAFAESGATPAPRPHSQQPPRAPAVERPAAQASARELPAREPQRPARIEVPVPQLPSERTAHGRAGDPALASRMAHLESMLRRLVASPLHRLDEADAAPAGPGVFLLSDSDQITSYYVESCQTLRIGIGNLVRGGRGGKSPRGAHSYADSGLKAKLAEYLGIGEAKVSQYMKDHCVVRWIQLDDDASLLAHFAIAVLRAPLNLD
jgi:hypothetical protein